MSPSAGWVAVVAVTAWGMLSGCSLLEKAAGSCTVVQDGDAGTATIRCPDGTSAVLRDGAQGPEGQRGAPGADGMDGDVGAPGAEGPSGAQGPVGASGSSCTAVRDADAGLTHITCTDGTSATVMDGQDGMSCTAVDNGDGSRTLRCPDGTSVTVANGKDGTPGQAGQPGQAGTSCTVTHDGGVGVLLCEDGTSAVLPGGSAGAASDGGATVALESPGPNCVHGGVAITSGTTTQYVCNVSPASVLSVVTAPATSVSYRDAVLGGTVALTGSDVVLGRGICFASSPGVTLSSTCLAVSGGTGDFSLSVSGLAPGTAWYARAFASSASGTALGNEVSFQTQALAVPTVASDAPLNASRTSVRLGGNVTEWGGSAVLARGVCWSTSPAPTLSDSKVLAGADVGAFTADATGLTPGTTYYARAFATNAQGTGYGQQVSFTTTALPLAVLSTSAPTAVSYRTASASGTISSDEGSPVTARGVCYATHSNPTRADSSVFAGAGIGTISASLTGLLPNTTYYLRAWAENAGGTAYGDVQSFTTLALTTPTLSTASAGGISNTTANSGGTISDDGGTNITSRGVCFSTAPLPTLAGSCTSDGTGAGTFSSLLGGLSPNTTYYARAFASNASGTAFGNQVTFATSNTVPFAGLAVVGTKTTTVTSGTTASGGGYVSQDGGSPVTARGVCWSLTANPTLANNCTNDGVGTGTFSSILTGLSGCNVTVNVRAYATNANGTTYGSNLTFGTGTTPTLATDPITNITTTSAEASGTVTDDGGCTISDRGFVYSGFPTPTTSTENFKLSSGSGSGLFSSTLVNLNSNITAYVRSYAINSKGTSYGPTRSFTTLVPTGLYVGQSHAGGVIAYLDASQQHGLIVATQNTGDRIATRLYCPGSGATTSRLFGTGKQNTASTVAICPVDTLPESLCDAETLNNYTDWFLPSQDELETIRINLYKWGLGNLSSPGIDPPPLYRGSTWKSVNPHGDLGHYMVFGNTYNGVYGCSVGAYAWTDNCSSITRCVREF